MDSKSTSVLMSSTSAFLLLALLVGFFPGEVLPARAAPGDTTRVSVDSGGAQANGWSRRTTISGDGRYVAFESDASNLVSGDSNSSGDIFVHDRQPGATTRVSVDSSGIEANGGSDAPAISSNGRFVAFSSYASNLVSGDTNGVVDIFVHDRNTGQTTRVSVDSGGAEANGESNEYNVAISGDGRYVIFSCIATNLVTGDTNGTSDIFLHDRQTSLTTRVSVSSNGAEGNGSSSAAHISNDGRFVAFSSGATNLVTGDTNNKTDIFVRDLQSGDTTRVSVNSSGEQADGGGTNSAISGDGRNVVFLSDSNNIAPGTEDYEALVYVHDRLTGQTSLASVYSDEEIMVGTLDQPTISSNGRYAAFSYYHRGNGDGIMDIWVRDLQLGQSNQAASGNDSSFNPSLSENGSLVAFWSKASNLVSGDTNNAPDIFVQEILFTPDLDPTVVSTGPQCGQACTYPTPTSVTFSVAFSESVSGVTSDDFVLTVGGDISGTAITGVSGTGLDYSVFVDTGTGDGTIRLDVVDDDSIMDADLNPLGGSGAGNGNFDSGPAYLVDKSTPSINGITRTDPNPTTAESVRFTVTFSENVTGVDTSDYSLTSTGTLTGVSVVDVSGTESTYTVTVNTGTGDGTLRLDLVDDDSIQDQVNIPLGGTGAGNGDFTSGEAYTVVKNAPSVTGILRADPNPTAAASVNFNVIFSETVTGVDASDFSLTVTGNLSGASVSGVSGSGEIYTITTSTGSGEGTLRLDLMDDDSITDIEGIPLGGNGTGNGNFTTGEIYSIDRATPSVFGILRADPNPTAAVTVTFNVVFSEPVSGVDLSDFTPVTSGSLTGVVVTGVNGSGTTYSVSLGTGSGDGTLRLDLIDNDSISDASGYPLGGTGAGNGSYTTGESYTINRVPKKLFTNTFRSNGRNDGWVLESGEDSNQGGSINAKAKTIYLGDDRKDRQYRAILHFPTFYLPDNSVITMAIVMVKGMGLVGSDPFITHQNILVDIRSGPFMSFPFYWSNALQASDFQNPASLDGVGMIQNNSLGNWYWTMLDGSAFSYINLRGVTQFRLRYQIDDDDNLSNDMLVFFSGNHDEMSDRPRLLIEYYLQR